MFCDGIVDTFTMQGESFVDKSADTQSIAGGNSLIRSIMFSFPVFQTSQLMFQMSIPTKFFIGSRISR